ncbi:hypothetical protein GCM10011505_00900 [Tistrella bauzanensis]|uniref:Cell division protein FtsL n=1 Tax=Tistrella bauzanensis TaxID=657419 RepID=A0ABQ1I749_9PROT|nr:hypothetical protein [Tistrella bauzanensis]GGB23515.1 hypothetical protein GCM10011505_00900 [Tistrella bauzanensis]
MIRPGTVLLLGCTAAIAAGLFWVKYRVASLEDAYVARNAELLREQESIHVLKAEWAYLNNPDRLERLAAEYLETAPVQGRQLVSLASLPLPRTETEPRPRNKPGTPPATWPLVEALPEARGMTVASAGTQGGRSLTAARGATPDTDNVVLTGVTR